MITIYHNPRCSKSRAALQLAEQYAQQKNLELRVIDYQKTPLNLAELTALHNQLGAQNSDMMREPQCGELQQQLQVLQQQPKLLQRPIISYGGRAIIGRPPELIHTLFSKSGSLFAHGRD